MKVALPDMMVLVTGAASGIGRAIAEAVAEAGCAGLMLTDRDAEVAQVAAGLGGGHVIADLAEEGAPGQIMTAARDHFGRVDGLVNAAGLTTRGAVADGSLATWEALMAVNARAPFFLMQAVLSDMRARGAAGSIVNILSMNSHCGSAELGIYAGTKGALATLTKNAANAHLAERIRVNGINLGWVATPSEDRMQADILRHGPGWQKTAAKTLPLGRLVGAEEAARLALFLLSDASVPMTGALVDLEQHVVGALH